MGLGLMVGIVADLARHDEDGCAHYRDQFTAVNEALAAAGLPPHDEPEDLAEEEVWSCDLSSYGGLHHLRRVAAHLALDGAVPSPVEEPTRDPLVDRYYARAAPRGVGLLARLLGRKAAPLAHAHLMLHSDAEGFYLPLDFGQVLFPEDRLAIAGGMVGSAPRLLAECRQLAEALEVPAGLDPEGGELEEAAARQAEAPGDWRRHGVAAFMALRLIRGCERSIETGAALVFC